MLTSASVNAVSRARESSNYSLHSVAINLIASSHDSVHYNQGLLTAGALMVCFGIGCAFLIQVRVVLARRRGLGGIRTYLKSDRELALRNPVTKRLAEIARGQRIPEFLKSMRSLWLGVAGLGVLLAALAFVV